LLRWRQWRAEVDEEVRGRKTRILICYTTFMARQVSKFVCQKCGFESPKWAGKCEGCNEWNTLVETMTMVKKGGLGRSRVSQGKEPIRLSQIKSRQVDRISTGINELDRVLGASGKNLGVVPGSVVLLAGEPGIGKSTLLTQLALCLGSELKSKSSESVLYVCGEESPEQIKLRIDKALNLKGVQNLIWRFWERRMWMWW